jgi:hypothetical protein
VQKLGAGGRSVAKAVMHGGWPLAAHEVQAWPLRSARTVRLTFGRRTPRLLMPMIVPAELRANAPVTFRASGDLSDEEAHVARPPTLVGRAVSRACRHVVPGRAGA